jgi:O-acetyl-ADP-ribose deacetylase (regulator of RNase III)
MSDPVRRAVIGETVLELVQGDITEQDTDAIVNAANTTLLGGGGVDGAIFAAAGYQQLIAETRELGGCEVGDAKITKGYNLKARHIIHAVGPRYVTPGHARLLASAYRRSLEVAAGHGLTRVAFPAIGTGSCAYPLYDAAQIALRTVCDFVAGNSQVRLIRFVLMMPDAAEAFAAVLDELVRERDDLRYCPGHPGVGEVQAGRSGAEEGDASDAARQPR